MRTERSAFLVLFLTLVPLTTYLRGAFLNNPLIHEPHGRQSQTALTTQQFANHEGSVWNYASPLNGQLWNNIYEFPLYQKIVAQFVERGVSLEFASRATGLCFFVLSFVFFVLLTRRCFGPAVTAWAALFYLVVPLNVLFSRAGLIDFAALSFLFSAAWMATQALQSPRPWGWLIGLAACGALTALVKITVWYLPAGFAWCAVCFAWYRGQLKRPLALGLLAALGFGFLVAVAWMRWVAYVHPQALGSGHAGWMLGQFADRFDPAKWARIAKSVRVMVLHDYLVVPWLLGVLAAWSWRPWGPVLVGLALLPILVQMRIHASNHDYYFLIGMPYMLILAAVGMRRLFQLPKTFQAGALAVMLGLLTHRLVKMEYVFGSMAADFSDELRIAKALKHLTKPNEVIFYDADPVGGGLEIPLYSERRVRFMKYDRWSKLTPQVFVFDEEARQFGWLAAYPEVWIEGYDDFAIYRVQGEFDPRRHIGTRGAQPAQYLEDGRKLDVCHATRGYLALQGLRRDRPVRVTATRDGREFWLPPTPTLSLPRHSLWGCEFIVDQPAQGLRADSETRLRRS